MLHRSIVFVAAALGATSLLAANLTIPTTHPRLWFGNAARLQQAQIYEDTHPINPAGGDIQFERALRGVVNGNTADCDLAADYLLAWVVENQGNHEDAYRQQGEELLLIYDWCHDRFSPAEISTLVTRWNAYIDEEIANDFANQNSEANNYFTGTTGIVGYDAALDTLRLAASDGRRAIAASVVHKDDFEGPAEPPQDTRRALCERQDVARFVIDRDDQRDPGRRGRGERRRQGEWVHSRSWGSFLGSFITSGLSSPVNTTHRNPGRRPRIDSR